MTFASTPEMLHALAHWAEVLEAPGFSMGQWVAPEPGEDGGSLVGWYDYGQAASAFTDEAHRLGWVRDFDWMRWAGGAKAQRLLHDPTLVASARAVDLSSLLTTVIRGERFSEGEFAGAFESGLLTAIVRRAGVLARAHQGDATLDRGLRQSSG